MAWFLPFTFFDIWIPGIWTSMYVFPMNHASVIDGCIPGSHETLFFLLLCLAHSVEYSIHFHLFLFSSVKYVPLQGLALLALDFLAGQLCGVELVTFSDHILQHLQLYRDCWKGDRKYYIKTYIWALDIWGQTARCAR